MDRSDAYDVLNRCGVHAAANFYTLSASQVDALLEQADRFKYRKPRNANGSRARYFHAHVLRTISKRNR